LKDNFERRKIEEGKTSRDIKDRSRW